MISKNKFEKVAKEIYGENVDLVRQLERFTNLINQHKTKFNAGKLFIFSSPGRIEVCGNHTDHNHGLAMCAAINLDTIAAVNKNDIDRVTIASIGYPVIEFIIDDLKINETNDITSMELARGIIAYFRYHGKNVGGFDATTTSDIFKGAGISSSACFGVLIAEILNVLYNDGVLDNQFLAKAAQYGENVYFKKPCGLLDQIAIATGGVSYIDFKNDELACRKINWNVDNTDFVLVNTGGDHTNLTHEYAAIKDGMKEVANFFSKDYLREVSETRFYRDMDLLKNNVKGASILKAIHFFNENKRVEKLYKYVMKQDVKKIAKSIRKSGESSSMLLGNTHPTGDQERLIDTAVAISKYSKFNKFASRVHGGGFLGTILTFIHDSSKTSSYVEYMSTIYGKDNVFVANIRNLPTTCIDIIENENI